MATLRELAMQVLLLLGIAWAAGFAAVAVSGPPEYRIPAGASLVLGLACASTPLLLAWNIARTIRSGVVTPAVVESVEHFVPDSFTTWDAIRNVVAHGSWRLPDGHVESFQTRDEWTAGLRPGSVVDLLVGPRSVLILGPRAGVGAESVPRAHRDRLRAAAQRACATRGARCPGTPGAHVGGG